MRQENTERTLRQLINSACPRTNVGLTDHEQGSLEVVFADNLRKLDIKPFYLESGGEQIHYYSEVANPVLFSGSSCLEVADKANYTVVRYKDTSGKIWTMEVFHPKFQEQDLGINRTSGNRTDRFIFTFSKKRGELYLSKVNTSLRRDAGERYSHDTVSIRIDEDGMPRETRVRLNQRTSFQRDPAQKIRESSPNYSHVHQFDGTNVLSTYVDIDSKIVFSLKEGFTEEHGRFEDYVATFERVRDYYEMPANQSFSKRIHPVKPDHTEEVIDTIVNEAGIISLLSRGGVVMKIDLLQLFALKNSAAELIPDTSSDIQRLFLFGKTQIETSLMDRAESMIKTQTIT